MNSFSNNDIALPQSRRRVHTLAAKLAALAEEYNTADIVGGLSKIYDRAESLKDDRFSCRGCACCCDQTIRPLAVFAVEIAYLVKGSPHSDISVAMSDQELCPALNVEKKECRHYLERPLGCRLFLPLSEWTERGGCSTYPHGPESRDIIRDTLGMVEQVNRQFVWAVGLHRDLSFDYHNPWLITQWFEPTPSPVHSDPFDWSI